MHTSFSELGFSLHTPCLGGLLCRRVRTADFDMLRCVTPATTRSSQVIGKYIVSLSGVAACLETRMKNLDMKSATLALAQAATGWEDSCIDLTAFLNNYLWSFKRSDTWFGLFDALVQTRYFQIEYNALCSC